MKVSNWLILLTLISLGYGLTAGAQVTIEPADQPIDLVGILKIVHGYGPPGYGAYPKTDVKISYWALEFPVQVNLACTPERPELADVQCGSTKRPRLFFPMDKSLESKARRLIGRRISLMGILRRWTGNYQTTPIYVDVLNIAPASPGR